MCHTWSGWAQPPIPLIPTETLEENSRLTKFDQQGVSFHPPSIRARYQWTGNLIDRHSDMASVLNIFQRAQYFHIQTINLRLSLGSDSSPPRKKLFVRQTLCVGKIEVMYPGMNLQKRSFSSLSGFLPWALFTIK